MGSRRLIQRLAVRPSVSCIAALAMLGACNSDDGVASRVPALGVYSYHAELRGPDGGPLALDGTLTLTYATRDSIAGTWAVPGLEPAPRYGGWNYVAYLLMADGRPQSGVGALTHRLTRSAAGLTCEGYHHRPDSPPEVPRIDGAPCTLTRR